MSFRKHALIKNGLPVSVDAHDDNHNDDVDDGNGVDLQGNCYNCDGSMAWHHNRHFGISNMTESNC